MNGFSPWENFSIQVDAKSHPGAATDRFRIPLDENGQLTTAKPFAIATISRRIDGVKTAPVFEFETATEKKFNVELNGGPVSGVRRMDFPAMFCPQSMHVLLDESDNTAKPNDTAKKVAIYKRKFQGVKCTYEFDGLEEAPDVVADAKKQLIAQMAHKTTNKFYQEPDYSIYSTPFPPEHEQVDISRGHRKATVDVGIADVILGLWDLEMETLGSCQCRSSGKAYVHLPIPGQAEQFQDILKKAGIESTLKSRQMKLKIGREMEEYPVDGGSVSFSPDDIDKAVAALRERRTL